MSLLGPRPTPLTQDSRPRRDSGRLEGRLEDAISLEVRWTWSRRSASRSLGAELRDDLEVVLSIRTEPFRVDPAGSAEVVACSNWRIVGDGRTIERSATMPPADGVLRGTVLDTAHFRHLDLADDRGAFVRVSLPLHHAAAPPVWSRIPDDLGIPGGCLSAPSLSVSLGDDASNERPNDSIARNGDHAPRSATR